MAEKATLALRGRNPDVLTCIANLSNDEVFTPPELANQMLDGIAEAWAEANDGDNIWSDKTITFLDPFTKSGVFLREITKRLIVGLEAQMPNLQRRVDHILTKQVFGVGITQLTALLARRSLYCSKWANGEHSVCDAFTTGGGNIWFEELQHTWVGGRERVETADKFGKPVVKTFDGRCSYCGASQKTLDRAAGRETHAYALIHTDDPHQFLKDAFGEDMQFDVIIGNPPYQLDDGGFGASASPIYQKFVEQAKALDPRLLTMIIPDRWFGGGKGLNDFRSAMLKDKRLRRLIDYENAVDVFQGPDIPGGVCYFLWNRDQPGDCAVVNVRDGQQVETIRPLDEFDTFIRDGEAVPIIHKVLANQEPKMSDQVSASRPFGLRTFVRPMKHGDITLRWQNGEGPYLRSEITVGVDMIDKFKVITSYVGYDHAGNAGKDGRRRVFSKIDVLPPGTICNETYLVIGAFDTVGEAQNLVKYMTTKFFRFLVSQFMYSHHITKAAYAFVPVQDMSVTWVDDSLTAKYGLNSEEISFIESRIRPMEGASDV